MKPRKNSSPTTRLKSSSTISTWSFVHPLVQSKYSRTAQGADGSDPISLLKSQLLIYLGEVSSNRRLVSALRYNARLCLLCGFNFLKTPSNGTFTNFRDRLGEDLFYEILHQLIAQTVVLKVIIGGDTAIDSTHLWAYSNKYGKKACSCKGKCSCPRVYSDTDATWGHKSKEYAFFGYKVHLIVDAKSQLLLDVTVTPANEGNSPQAKPLLKGAKEKHLENPIATSAMGSAYDAYENYHFVFYNTRTSVKRAYSEEKGVHHLANLRVRGLAKVKIHAYLALCAQVIKSIGVVMMVRSTKPEHVPCLAGA